MKQKLLILSSAFAIFIAPYLIPSPRIAIPSDLLAASDLIEPQPVYRFTSDGCSGGLSIAWRVIFRHPPDFESCCVTHDFAYWRGGTADDRAEADAKLLQCIDAAGYPLLAWVMWAGVRPGGSPYLPTSWRWAYGWYYGHGYTN
jgi:hypothetical protein